jgi:hypothetical protein
MTALLEARDLSLPGRLAETSLDIARVSLCAW